MIYFRPVKRCRNCLRNFILIFLVVTAFPSKGQYLIRGNILDANDKKPLAYASIELQKENIGTVTNNDGYFEIKSAKKEVQLKIGLLGYDSKIIDLVADQTSKEEIIYLTPKVFTLDEVVVAPEKIENLIKAIYENYKAKKNQIYLADAFYRDYCTVDNFPVNASEIFYKVQLNQSGIGNWNFIQGRSAEAKTAVEKPSVDFLFSSMINNSFYSRNFPITEFTPIALPQNLRNVCVFPICENPMRDYKYKRIGEKSIDNKKVAVISFSPKGYNDKFRFTGKFEVIEDDLQIIYMELSLDNSKFFDRVTQYPWKGKRDQFIDSCYLKHAWHYKQVGKDWQLERLENSVIIKVVQLKRTETPSKSLIVAKSGKVNSFTSQIYFYNHKKYEISGLNKQSIKENDRKLIRENHYDPDFWIKNSTTLTEIPFEKRIKESLTKNGFYGNLFSGGIKPTIYYPQCSDLENRVISELGYNYYDIFKLFIDYYFYTTPEKELYLLFDNDIKPVYKAYIEKIGNHKVPENKLLKLESAINRIPYNKYPDVADILFVFMQMDPSASNKVLNKLRQNEKKYSNK